jgi:hypothetical protein
MIFDEKRRRREERRMIGAGGKFLTPVTAPPARFSAGT